MRAILLAAGLGTRLAPITNSIPKCLVPIFGIPLLAYWLELLEEGGVSDVLINTHYLPDEVRKFISDHPTRLEVHLAHEETLLGTGGTILHNKSFTAGDAFFVAHADNLAAFDLRDFHKAHLARRDGVEITMMTYDTDSPTTCGIVEVSESGIVLEFHEKVSNPPGNRANGAIYIFEPSIIQFIESLDTNAPDISLDVLPHFMNRIGSYHNVRYLRDIGTIRSLRQAESEFSEVYCGKLRRSER